MMDASATYVSLSDCWAGFRHERQIGALKLPGRLSDESMRRLAGPLHGFWVIGGLGT